MKIPKISFPIVLVVLYALFGILWIEITDQFLQSLAHDQSELTRLQTYKGWVFVAGSTILFYGLIRIFVLRIDRAHNRTFQAEERLQLAIRSANLGLFDTDLRSETTYYSPEWKAQIGYGVDEIGDSFEEWRSRVHPDDLEDSLEEIDRCLENPGRNFWKEFRLRHKDGSWRWILGTAYVERDDQGRPVRVVGLHHDVTDLRLVLDELNRSDARFRSMVEYMPVGVFLIDEKGLLNYCNRAVEELTGCSMEDLLGVRWIRCIAPADREKVISNWQQTVSEQRPNFVETGVVRPDQSIRWCQISTAPTVVGGELIGHVGMIVDLTDLYQTTLKLQASEIRYENLFNSIRDVIVIADLDRVILDANQPALRDTFGYEVDEVVGSEASLLYASKEDFTKMGEVFFNHEHMNLWQVIETNYRRKDGEVFRAELFPLKMTDDNGRVIANIAMIRDISKRTRVEEMLNHVFDSMGEGMAIVDREFRILAANKAYCNLFGESRDDIVGRHCYEVSHKITHPCHLNGLECPARESFDSGDFHSVVHRHQDEHGRIYYHENRGYPLKDESGQVTSVIEVFNDITQQKVLEEELRHAQKMEAIGTLTGGIAHDFNNILSVIVGHGTLMQMKMEAGHPMRESVHNIMQAAERAASLTQRLLAFSRKQIMQVESLILCDVVTGMEGLLRKMTRENIDLEIDLTPEPFIVEADRGQVEQVIMNLVINASQAITYHGTIRLGVGRGMIDQSFIRDRGFGEVGEYAVLTVSDNGCGMDEQTLSKIFEPFFTTKPVGEGTGLGLSVVYGIIKQHNGFIDCTSAPGSGTTFSVYLPLTETDVIPAASETEFICYTVQNVNILIAEDDDNVRMLLKELLEQAGYSVYCAATGLEAIRLYVEHRKAIGLVLLDLIMPHLNGRETLDEIRKHNPDVRAIFMSGYTDDILQTQNVQDENVPFLQKPISPRALLDKIRSVLEQSGPGAGRS